MIIPYPIYKKVLWRFLRVFIASFIAGASVVLSVAKEEAFKSWDNFLTLLIFPAGLAGATAGINAIGKLAREYFGTRNKNGAIDKLPI